MKRIVILVLIILLTSCTTTGEKQIIDLNPKVSK